MNYYGPGTKVMLDWIESKPRGVVQSVKPNPDFPDYPRMRLVTVKLDKPFGLSDVAVVPAYTAIPLTQILKPNGHSYHVRYNDAYQFEQP